MANIVILTPYSKEKIFNIILDETSFVNGFYDIKNPLMTLENVEFLEDGDVMEINYCETNDT